MIKYWIKVIQTKNPILLNMYTLLKNDAENNINYNGMNWAYHIKSIFDNIGMSYIWQNQSDIDSFNVKLIIQRILDIYKQSWYSNINNSNKLEYYNKYKHTFALEKYMNCIFDKKFRISLTKFRLSAHDLAIETGRYTNVPREQRFCLQCNMNVVETEYHFLLACPKYRELRHKYFKRYFCHWPNLNKFESLMSSQCTKTINNLAKFVYYAFQLRLNV